MERRDWVDKLAEKMKTKIGIRNNKCIEFFENDSVENVKKQKTPKGEFNTNTEISKILQRSTGLKRNFTEISCVPPFPDLPQIIKENRSMYWIDAYENKSQNIDEIFLFGKIKVSSNTYESCCLRIQNISLVYYFVPHCLSKNLNSTKEDVVKIIHELKILLPQKCDIDNYSCKIVRRGYCFDLPLKYGKNLFVKVKYPSRYGALPPDLIGDSFSHVIGHNASIVELLLVKRKIWGPCWIKFRNYQISTQDKTWCKYEFCVKSTKDVVSDPEPAPLPPLTLLSMKLEILDKKIIHFYLTNCKLIDGVFSKFNTTQFTLCRDSEKKLSKSSESSLIYNKNPDNFTNEKAMLSSFLSYLMELDPDVLLGHNLLKVTLSTLLSRLQKYKFTTCSALGRLKRLDFSKSFYTSKNRFAISGRLLCDTFLSAKNLLYNEPDYSVQALSQKFVPDLCQAENCESELSLGIAEKLSILPLTLQIARISGGFWNSALMYTRASTNEMLLMHEFHDRKFILPDRPTENCEEDLTKSKQKYKGGLVLVPRTGLYTTNVIVLDFQSLYPSLIIEFNLCFTQGTELKVILPVIIENLLRRRREIKRRLSSAKSDSHCIQLDIQQRALKLTANSIYGCLGFPHSRFYEKSLASKITKLGREVLTDSQYEVRSNLNLDVIYGDTDSIMINTKCSTISESISKK